jgi:hypothetical protein
MWPFEATGSKSFAATSAEADRLPPTKTPSVDRVKYLRRKHAV